MDRARESSVIERRRPGRSRWNAAVLRVAATAAAASLALAGGVTAAQAAPGDQSHATGKFLGGSIAALLAPIANVGGARADNNGTVPAQTATQANTLNLTALSAVNVTIPGGVQLPLNFTNAGVVGQYASAPPNGSAVGSSGLIGADGAIGTGVTPAPGVAPGPLNVNLTNAVDSLAGTVAGNLVSEIGDVGLQVGAVSARATQSAPANPQGGYTIAGSTLAINSSTVAGLASSVNSTITPLQTTVNNLSSTLNGALGTLLGSLGLVQANVTVGTTSLTGAVSSLLTGTITDPAYPGVAINLSTGQVLVDLGAIHNLNNLPANHELMDAATVALIQQRVVALIAGLLDRVETTLVNAVRGLSVTGGVAVVLPIVGTRIELLGINTNVGRLLDGDTTGITILSTAVTIPGGVQAVLRALATPLQNLVTSIRALSDVVIVPVNTLLSPALGQILPRVVSLRANVQSTNAGVFSETALRLNVLPNIANATLDLATATVGPNTIDANADVGISSPTAGQTFTVPNPGDVTPVPVSGVGQPNAQITVQVPGRPTQAATVGADGTWSVSVPGVPVGSHTATATQNVDGTTTQVAFSVAPAPDVAITAPAQDETFRVPGPGDLADVPVSGTGAPGSQVSVAIPGQTPRTATVAGDGTWRVDFLDLPLGDYTATATQAVDNSTATRAFEVVEIPDVTIDLPEDGEQYVLETADDTQSVEISGTGDPGATIELTLPGAPAQSVLVGEDGAWTATFAGLTAGGYTLTAVQAGDGSRAQTSFSVVLADDVVITAPQDDEIVVVPGPGSLATVEVSGFGQAGEEVTVSIPGVGSETTTVAGNGEWSVTLTGVPTGDRTVTAEQENGSTDTVAFTVVAAADVAIGTPTPNQQITVAADGDTADATVSGTGQPGANVLVTLPGVGERTVVVGGDGSWTTTFSGVEPGEHTATAEQDVDDSTASVAFEVVVVDDVVIDTPADGDEIVLPRGVPAQDLEVSGSGFPGATVSVDVVGVGSQDVDVTDEGTWSVVFPAVGPGTYTVTASQGADQSTDAATFTVVAPAEIAISQPTEGQQFVVPAPSDTTPVTVSGTGQPGEDVTVTVGDLDPIETTVTDGGAWSVNITGVPTGTHLVTATQENGSTQAVTIGVVAAADVAITAPTGGQVISVPNATDTTPVTVTGTAQPGAEVTVRLDDDEEQVVDADAQGGWSAAFEGVGVGSHTATVTQDADDTTASVTFTVAQIPDVAITAPAPFAEIGGGDDDLADVTVSGTGAVGADVLVVLSSGATQSAVVDGDGGWTVDFADLPPATYTVTATQSSDSSVTASQFTVVEGPEDVEIDAPVNGARVVVPDTDDTQDVTIAGTGEPGATVTVTLPGRDPLTATVGDDGWSVTFDDLPVGSYSAIATQAGGGAAASVAFTIAAAADVAVTTPVNGTDVLVAGPDALADIPFAGTGEPGATVTVTVPDGPSASATVGDDGAWSLTLEGVPVGSHTVNVAQSDGSSTTVELEVVAAADVAITAPTPGAIIQVADEGDTARVTVTGTGAAGTTVAVALDGGAPQNATVGTNGTWQTTFTGVAAGAHSAVATQAADQSTARVDFTVAVAADIEITAPEPGTRIVVPGEDDVESVEVSGTAAPAAAVEVAGDGLPTQETTAGDDGVWSVEFPAVGVGEYAVTATQDADDSTSSTTFEVVAADDVEITVPAGGAELGAGTDGVRDVVISGTAQAGATVTVTIPGADPEVATAGDDGAWTVMFAALAVGPYTATATQSADDSSDTVAFDVVAAPEEIAIAQPADGAQIVVPDEGSATTVTVSGTGEAGATVTVSGAGVTTQTATVGEDGTWSVAFTGLGVDAYALTATQDADGSTAEVAFEIVAAADVTVTSPEGGDVIAVPGPGDSATVEVAGTGQPGAVVTVTIGAVPPVTATVATNGEWQAEVPGVPVGPQTIAVSQDDGSSTSVLIEVVAIADVTITAPATGSTVSVADDGDTATVIASGAAQPGATVVVALDGGAPRTLTATDEGTWETTYTGVAIGAHTVVASQAADGSRAESSFTVAATPDVEIIAPTGGTRYVVPGADDTRDVAVSGTGAIGAEITVTGPGLETQTTTVTSSGTWTVTFEDVGVDEYTVTAAQEADDSEAEVAFTVAAAEAVSILAPADGDELGAGADGLRDVVFSGEGEAGSPITVEIAGVGTQGAVVQDDGTWTVTFADLPVGPYTAVAAQEAGGSPAEVDFEVIAAPEEIGLTAPVPGTEFVVPDDDATTPVTISGTGEAGAEVTVEIAGEGTFGTAVDENGVWGVIFPGLGVGDYDVTATQDVDGTTASTDFTIVAAEDVTLDEPTDGEEYVVAGPGDTAAVTASGSGQPGATVTVSIPGAAPVTVTVLDDGTWTATVTGVPVGERTLTATQSDGSTQSADITVIAAADVSITAPTTGEIFAVPGPGGTTTVTVSGAGQPDTTVSVSIPGVGVRTPTVGEDGAWEAVFSGVPIGAYTATATQALDGTSAQVGFTVAETADVTIDEPVAGDQVVVADADTTADVVVSGAGDPDAEITITGNRGVGPLTTTVSPEGTWSATLEDLAVGDYELTATQDSDGSTAEVAFDVVVAIPVTITAPTEGEKVLIPEGETTTTVTATGTGRPGAEVTVTVDGLPPVTVLVGDGGEWSAEVPGVPAGEHPVTVTQEGGSSVTLTISVEASDENAAVRIIAPADGSIVTVPAAGDTASVTVSGLGEPGANVEVGADGVEAQTVAVGDDGTWSATFDDLGVGEYTFTVTQDVDGSTATIGVTIAVEGAEPGEGPQGVVTKPVIVRGTGQSQIVDGTGFVPGETVFATVNSTPFELTPQVADATGTVEFSFPIGADFELGDHTVDLRGSITGDLPGDRELTAFRVIDRAGGALPGTGSDANLGFGIALGLAFLLAGGMLWGFRRRRS